jgi:hypothetical protein
MSNQQVSRKKEIKKFHQKQDILENMMAEIFENFSCEDNTMTLKQLIVFAKVFEVFKFNKALEWPSNQLHVYFSIF